MEKNNKIVGIIGSIIGALIASIPWILMYIFANLMVGILAFLISFGALKGYEIAKAEKGKDIKWIVGIVTILVVILITLLIIPGLLLLKEDILFNMHNIKVLYSNDEFVGAIIRDLIYSLAFAIGGIFTVFPKVKTNEDIEPIKEEFKKVFEKYNAFDKNNAIAEEEILKHISYEKFKLLKDLKIIKKYKGRYYYKV